MKRRLLLCALLLALSGCESMQGEREEEEGLKHPKVSANRYDVLVRGGTVYDGTGQPGREVDVAIKGERVVALLPRPNSAEGVTTVDATGLAVAPGFINMLSWAPIALIEDPRSMSDLKQGVTLEVFGEGWSEGPLNDKMKKEVLEQQGDIKFDVA